MKFGLSGASRHRGSGRRFLGLRTAVESARALALQSGKLVAARVRVSSFRVAIAVTARSAIACSSALPPREKVRGCVSRTQGAHALLIEILSPSLNTIPAPSNDGLHHAGCVRDGWRVRCRSRQQLEGDRGSELERPAALRPFDDWREACGLPRGLMPAEHSPVAARLRSDTLRF
jgi:hypothetical protein